MVECLSEYNLDIMKRGIYYILLTLLSLCALLSGYLSWKDAQRASVFLDWTTASEINTIGFNIYRRNTVEREYGRVNLEMIPASQDALSGSDYSYMDTEVNPGVVYYYILENVYMDGRVARSDPITVEARSNYLGYLLLFFLFSCLTILIIINRRWFIEFLCNRAN